MTKQKKNVEIALIKCKYHAALSGSYLSSIATLFSAQTIHIKSFEMVWSSMRIRKQRTITDTSICLVKELFIYTFLHLVFQILLSENKVTEHGGKGRK